MMLCMQFVVAIGASIQKMLLIKMVKFGKYAYQKMGFRFYINSINMGYMVHLILV